MPIARLPDDGGISVSLIDLDESGAGWERFAEGLPAAEREQARRYRFDADRLRFARCRHLLRAAVAPSLGCAPAEVALRFGPHGKPHLDHDTDLQFNLSHTRGAALLAIARGAEVGVDIENTGRKVDLDGVAAKVFTERERGELGNVEGERKTALFFRYWTAKEAFLKATGHGLSLAPATVEAFLPDLGGGRPTGSFRCAREPEADSMSSWELDVPPPFRATLCAPARLLDTPPEVSLQK